MAIKRYETLYVPLHDHGKIVEAGGEDWLFSNPFSPFHMIYDGASPRDEKGGKITKSFAREGVWSTRLGNQSSQSRKHERENGRARSRKHPSEDRDPTIRSQRGRQQEHARSDHVADDQRRRHPQSDGPFPNGT